MLKDNTPRKYRHEHKFLIDARQKAVLLNRLKNLLEPDPHVGDDGNYWIRSVYFDDYENSAFCQNESGIDSRSKYRIRIYNVSPKVVHLECKSKKNSMINKESITLTGDQALDLIAGKYPEPELVREKGELLGRFDVLMRTKLLRARSIIEYERTPFICKQGNVRITLDDNITSSPEVNRFFDKNNARYPVLSKGMSLLEVKFDEYLPSYIKNNLELGSLQQTSFSKYYLGRKYSHDRYLNSSPL